MLVLLQEIPVLLVTVCGQTHSARYETLQRKGTNRFHYGFLSEVDLNSHETRRTRLCTPVPFARDTCNANARH